MNKVKFDEIVQARAHENVKRRIESFKATIEKALETLAPGHPGAAVAALDAIARPAEGWKANVARDKKWPKFLWEDEEEKVAAEILSTLDIVAKSILASGVPRDPSDPFYEPTAEAAEAEPVDIPEIGTDDKDDDGAVL